MWACIMCMYVHKYMDGMDTTTTVLDCIRTRGYWNVEVHNYCILFANTSVWKQRYSIYIHMYIHIKGAGMCVTKKLVFSFVFVFWRYRRGPVNVTPSEFERKLKRVMQKVHNCGNFLFSHRSLLAF